MLISGTTFPVDGITLSVLALALWMLVSLLWTESEYAITEILLWYSYFLLFMAARTVPLEIVLWAMVVNPSIFAGLQLNYAMNNSPINRKGYIIAGQKFPIFGNSNHNASFMLTGFYASLWLGFNVTPWILIISLLICTAIMNSRCRGAILAVLVSIALAGILTWSEPFIYIFILALIIASHHSERFHELRGISIASRIDIYKDAIRKIHPRYITGRGMNYFRDTQYGRVHNDTIEIVGEIGIVGYLLLLSVFWNLNLDPIMTCFLISFFIAGLFFFPLREVHTAAPFWVVMGAASTGSVIVIPVFKIVAVLSIIFVCMFVFQVFCNLMEWDLARMKSAVQPKE